MLVERQGCYLSCSCSGSIGSIRFCREQWYSSGRLVVFISLHSSVYAWMVWGEGERG